MRRSTEVRKTPPDIAERTMIAVNDSSTESVQTFTKEASAVPVYSLDSQYSTPIVVPIPGNGTNVFDNGYPLLTDPRSIRLNLELELADLEVNRWTPGDYITNGDFADGLTGWTTTGDVSVVAGKLTIVGVGSISNTTAIVTIPGYTYTVGFNNNYKVTFGAGISVGDLSLSTNSHNHTDETIAAVDGSVYFDFTATTTTSFITVTTDYASTYKLDNFVMALHLIDGSNYVVNGNFSQALTTGWTATAYSAGVVSIISGICVLDCTAASGSAATAAIGSDSMTTVVGQLYKVYFTLSGDIDADLFYFTILATDGAASTAYYSNRSFTTFGEKSFTFEATTTSTILHFGYSYVGGKVYLDDISMLELYPLANGYRSPEGWFSSTGAIHTLEVGAGDGPYTTTKIRLNRNLPAYMGQYLNASGDTSGTDTPSNYSDTLHASLGGDAYFPPSCSAYPTRLEPFEWIELRFPFSDNAKTIRIYDPARSKTLLANIMKRRNNEKMNFESTKWATNFKRLSTDKQVPCEDLTYDYVVNEEGGVGYKNTDRYAAGEWFEDMAVGDKVVYPIYLADMFEEFDKNELMHLPEIHVAFKLKRAYRSLFVKHIAPTCTATSLELPKISYPQTLVPDIANPSLLEITYDALSTVTTTPFGTTPTVNTMTNSYFNINKISTSYETYASKHITKIPQFFNAFQRVKLHQKTVPNTHSGSKLLILDTYYGNPTGVFIFPEITADSGDYDTTAFFNRRWRSSPPLQFKSVRTEIEGEQYPTDASYKAYNMDTYSGLKREYIEMLRKSWKSQTCGCDEGDFDPYTEKHLPLMYVPFEAVVRDVGKTSESVLGTVPNYNKRYSFEIEFGPTDSTAWGTTHDTALRGTKFTLAYLQDYSVRINGNNVENTA